MSRRPILSLALVALILTACSSSSSSSELTSAAVVQALSAAGLEAEGARAMTVDDFGLAPKLTEDGTRFLVPSLGPDKGGRAFVFKSVDDLRKTKEYYDAFGRSSAALFSWTFANEALGVLVQVNGELAEAKANAYKSVVDGLKAP